jgi:hypothetical protein
MIMSDTYVLPGTIVLGIETRSESEKRHVEL